MANPTSNFNWQMPTASDLVTDLPADFEVFGQAVDTSLADLKGGTTDQVLAKNSNTDMDFKWVTSDDANAIQNSIVDAKGDLIAASANDTPARLAVGANDTFIRANSAAATGLEWTDGTGTWTPTYSNFTIGNGTVTSRYVRVGKQITIYWRLVFGSTTAITGAYPYFTLPFNANSTGLIFGLAHYEDNGVGDFSGGCYISGGSTVYPIQNLTAAWNGLSATGPFTWATNDKIEVNLTYQVA
jgi:hypothetical protein